jgi:uncharacterized membrane protein
VWRPAAGIGLAIYVAHDYLTQNFNSCKINQLFNCGGVYASGHTSLFGIPFYVTGLVWFPTVFTAGLVTSGLGKRPVNGEILVPLLMVGNIFTIYLWYLELGVIHIICPLCVSLYAVNYGLTIIVLVPLLSTGTDNSETESSGLTDGTRSGENASRACSCRNPPSRIRSSSRRGTDRANCRN